MKVAVILLSLVCLGLSAPQPRKTFHENMEDFFDIIMEESGHEIEHIMGHYVEFDEFLAGIEYLSTNSFRDLVSEMESLPEFVAVVDFLEKDNIDIIYFIDRFHEMLDNIPQDKRLARHELSGRDFSAYITDITALFPKTALAELYDQKMSEDDEFRTSIENLNSEEWNTTVGALLESETFQTEIQVLEEHGIKVTVIIDEILAVFGQN